MANMGNFLKALEKLENDSYMSQIDLARACALSTSTIRLILFEMESDLKILDTTPPHDRRYAHLVKLNKKGVKLKEILIR